MNNDNLSEFEVNIRTKYHSITETLIERRLTFTAMESCTSGLIASLITDTEGASAIMEGAFVSYSNHAKVVFGVPKEVIEEYGVYSISAAEAMCSAAKQQFNANCAVGITGSFGNVDPANSDSVPGEVYIAVTVQESVMSYKLHLPLGKSRFEYKLLAADAVADLLMELLGIA